MAYLNMRGGAALRFVAALTLSLTITAPTWASHAAGAQASLPGIAEAAPESTVVFHWTDLDRDGEQWQQTEELLSRVGAPDALDLWETVILDDGERSGGITGAELDALLGGEMAIVVLPAAVEHVAAMAMAEMESDTLFRATPQVGADVERHGVAAILRPSDIDAAWGYAERQLADAATEMGTTVEESTIGGAEVLKLDKGDHASRSGTDQNDESDGMDHWMHGGSMYGQGEFAAARAGDYIIAGTSDADLTQVIDVVEGRERSLAESAEAQAVVAELPSEALSLTYINGQGILDALDPEAIAMLQSMLLETPVELLGSQTGLTISADEPGFRFESVTILNDAASLDDYTVENDPAVADAAARVPAGTFAFQAGRLAENSFDGAAFAIAQAVNAAEAGESWTEEDADGMMFPTEEEMAAEIAAASATLGFDIQTDLFDLLGDEFVAFSSFPAITMEDVGIDAVAALSTTDPTALAETLEHVAAWIDRSDSGVDIIAREVDGSRVYVAVSEEMAGAPGLEFGVVGDRAVVGLGGGIDALTVEPTASLADDERYQTVMGLLPDEYYQVGYLDIGQAIDPLLNLMNLFNQFSEGGAPTASTSVVDVESLRNISALGAVAIQEGNVSGSSAILFIGG